MRGLRRRVALVLALALVTAAAAAAVVLAAERLTANQPTSAHYFAEVEAVCDFYGRQLDLIPAPDASAPGSIYETVGTVIPIVEKQLAGVREIKAPRSLQADVERFFETSEKSIDTLREVRAAAEERDIYAAALAFTRFENVRNRAQKQAKRIGFRC